MSNRFKRSKHGQIRINRKYTKTRTSRQIPLSRELLTLLADKRQLHMTEYCFPIVTSNSFGHFTLKPWMKQAEVRPIRFHDFRHTFATHCLMLGLTVIDVKELLGHKKLESTAIYLHFVPGRLTGLTDRLTSGSAVFHQQEGKVIAMR